MINKIIRVSCLLLVIFVILPEITEAEYKKSISSEERIAIEGVSILPPKGENWDFSKTHPGSIQFGKKGTTKDQSVLGVVVLSKLPEIRTKEKFLELISEQRRKDTKLERYKLILNKNELSDERKIFCVRFHTIYEDHGAKNLPASSDYLIVEVIGITCKHPYHQNIAVDIGFSQRTLKNNTFENFESIANDFIHNVKFIAFSNANKKKGHEFLQKEKYQKAIEYFNLALSENPKDFGAYNFRGVAHEKISKFAEAIQDFNKAIGINPQEAVIYYNRGVVYSRQSKHVQALQDYTKAISLNPKDEWAYYNRALTYEKLFKYVSMIQDLEKAIEINPNHILAHNNLGWIYATCENKSFRNGTKAVAFALKAINLREDAAGLDTLAAAYVETKQYKKAFETYKKVILKDKSFVNYYQKSLKEKGCYLGSINGIYNHKLEEAMKTCISQGKYL